MNSQLYMLTAQQAPSRGADIAAVTAASCSSFAWIAPANTFMQLVVTALALIAGCFSIYWNIKRLRDKNPPAPGDKV